MCLIRSTTRVEYPYSLSYLQTIRTVSNPCAWPAATPLHQVNCSQESVS